MTFRFFLFVAVALLGLTPDRATAQNVAVVAPRAATPPVISPVSARINAVLSAPVFANAVVGVYARSLDNDRVLYARNIDYALVPASNQKLLTGSTALARLGPTFRYTTTLYRTGEVDRRGRLSGDLYLRGTGDPSLDSAALLDMAKNLRASGVREFSGRIVADATRFDDRVLGEGWQWDDESADYQPQVSALNCDENVLLWEAAAGDAPGKPVVVMMGGANADALGFRHSRYVSVINQAVTGSADAKATLTFDRTRGRNEITISGTLPVRAKAQSEAVTIENPALFAATRLYELLPMAGVKTPKPEKWMVETGTVPIDATVAVEHSSSPLSDLLRHFLKTSDNLYGECLLKTLGAEKGARGSVSEGATVVRAFLRERGVESAGLYIADGSGLSRMDSVTPRLLVDLLTAWDKTEPQTTRDVFFNALPESGVDGTLRNRMKNTPAQGKIHAKTGTLFGVSSLSGYLTTTAGERIVFSILMNQWAAGGRASDVRTAQDEIALALVNATRP